MAIREISGTESTRGSVTIVQIETTDPNDGIHERARAFAPIVAWEASCAACGMLCTNLTEDEAQLELESHVCPDVPPCEREFDSKAAAIRSAMPEASCDS